MMNSSGQREIATAVPSEGGNERHRTGVIFCIFNKVWLFKELFCFMMLSGFFSRLQISLLG